MKRYACAIAALALLCPSLASAAVISYNGSYGPVSVPFTSTPLVSLSQFDPILGTLTKVTLTLDAETTAGTISFDNEAGVPTTLTLGIGASVTASAPSALAVTAVPLQLGNGSVTADDEGAADFIGADAFSVIGGSGNDSDSASITLAGLLVPYIGVGTFNVDVQSSLSTFLSTSGGFGPLDAIAGLTSGLVTVTYEYTAVPEASSMIMVGLAGLGLGSAVYRKRRHTA